MGPIQSDPNKWLIPLTVIPLSCAHCSLLVHKLLLKLVHAAEKIFQFCKNSFSHFWMSQVLNGTTHQTHETDPDEL